MELKVHEILLILFAMSKYIECQSSRQSVSEPALYCADLKPQNNIDIKDVRDLISFKLLVCAFCWTYFWHMIYSNLQFSFIFH